MARFQRFQRRFGSSGQRRGQLRVSAFYGLSFPQPKAASSRWFIRSCSRRAETWARASIRPVRGCCVGDARQVELAARFCVCDSRRSSRAECSLRVTLSNHPYVASRVAFAVASPRRFAVALPRRNVGGCGYSDARAVFELRWRGALCASRATGRALTPHTVGVCGRGANTNAGLRRLRQTPTRATRKYANSGCEAPLHLGPPSAYAASLFDRTAMCAERSRDYPKCFVSRRVRISLGC